MTIGQAPATIHFPAQRHLPIEINALFGLDGGWEIAFCSLGQLFLSWKSREQERYLYKTCVESVDGGKEK